MKWIVAGLALSLAACCPHSPTSPAVVDTGDYLISASVERIDAAPDDQFLVEIELERRPNATGEREVVCAPRVLCLADQSAEIYVGDEDGLNGVTTVVLVTERGDGDAQAFITVAVEEHGVIVAEPKLLVPVR